MTSQDRSMLSFRSEGRRFNYRTAGIVVRDRHVLVCREDDESYVLLPGGRVEFGETSDRALEREFTEETGFAGTVGRHVFSVENFFARDGESFHELAAYYQVELPADFPFVTGRPCLTTRDEGHDLCFIWVPLDDTALASVNLLPLWLRPHLQDLPQSHRHMILDER